ncbi:MAG: tetratricopeptide repeat protein [Gammaproteobacteria bacterium]|nr:tetratricopeptide repeat protein [Gammaproteobacteria bacterium]
MLLSTTGKKEEAISSFRMALSVKPDYAEAMNNLGLTFKESGRFEEAIDCYEKAISTNSNYVEAYYNLGNVREKSGQADEAISYYRKALIINPGYAEAYNNLGGALLNKGIFDEAIENFRIAVSIKPDCTEFNNNYGNALIAANQINEAIVYLEKAISTDPHCAEAYSNLGNAFKENGQYEKAIDCYRMAMSIKPNYAEAYYNLGCILKVTGQLKEAIASYRQALIFKPDYPEAYNNLGNVLAATGQYDDAIASFKKAVSLKPEYTESFNNAGNVLRESGHLDEAEKSFRQALQINPDYPDAQFNWSMTLLLKGDFEHGWQKYAYRFLSKEFANTWPVLSIQQWQGESLHGKTLFVWDEQGLGDTIQFVRYIQNVKEDDVTILFKCKSALTNLLQSVPYIDKFVQDIETVKADYHIPLLSLPQIYNTTIDTVPDNVPYINANSGLKERWQERLKEDAGFKVGLVWAGNPEHGNDRFRSISLKSLSGLFNIAGVSVYSLQKGPGAEQLKEFAEDIRPVDMTEQLNDLTDTAALIASLDLVISVDTCVAHLAGAMGCPVWILVPANPDWRWLLEREDSPWYPSMRLYRQITLGDWGPVIQRISHDLQNRVTNRSTETSLASTEISIEINNTDDSQIKYDRDDSREESTTAAIQVAIQHHQSGQLREAEIIYERVLANEPDNIDANHLLGVIASQLGNNDRAIKLLQKSVVLNPEFAQAHNNLGNVFREQGNLNAAIDCFEKATVIKQDYAEAFNNMGYALKESGQIDKAIFNFKKAISLMSDYPDAQFNWSMALLQKGDFESGWKKYRYRFQKSDFSEQYPTLPVPAWQGESLQAKTLLVLFEQGRGDTIQFVRYLELIKEQNVQVVMNCPEELRSLLKSVKAIDRFVEPGIVISADYHVYLMSLPEIYKTTLHNIPVNIPYIYPDPERVSAWQSRLQNDSNFKLGLTWSGNNEHSNDRFRSVLLNELSGLLILKNVSVYSLQKGAGEEQISDLDQKIRPIDMTDEINNFADTAALIANLDLVISVDTCVAHLAGAMGCPVWTLLPANPDWRWLLEREDSPWYPSMRLYRQPILGDWGSTIARVAQELDERIKNRSTKNIIPDDSLAQTENSLAIDRCASLSNANRANESTITRILQKAVQHHQAGQFQQADELYRQILKLDPEHMYANYLSGMVANANGNNELAIRLLNNAIKINPGFADAHNNLAIVLKKSGQLELAISSYKRAVEIKPGFAEAYNNLGILLSTTGRHEEAILNYQKALSIRPDYAEAANNLGISFKETGRYAEAITSYKKAVAIKPDYAEAYYNLGLVAVCMENHNEAVDYYRQALSIKPDYADALINLGNILKETGKINEAIACYRKVLSVKPDFNEVWHMLSGCKKYTSYDDDVRRMEQLFCEDTVPEVQKIYLAFSLGKAFEDLKEYDRAFDCIRQANRLKRARYQYSISRDKALFEEQKNIFSEKFFAEHKQSGNMDSSPIFILGMPRSGTSLVEQILASHHLVYGAGELQHLANIFNEQKNDRSINSASMPGNSGAEYIKRIRRYSDSARHITDKMPANFRFTGFIKSILPNARIIHCMRDPMDNCWSIYKNYFSSMESYAYDMDEIVQYYNIYQDLMNHWHQVIPDFIYDLRYEELVSDPEEQVKKLVEYCELPWDEACLSFFNTERRVSTASDTQIRRPIYKDSVQLWRHYEKQLASYYEILSK